ncbi:MAG: hypothetical protein V1928_04060 [Parcubacteria group bacterium]
MENRVLAILPSFQYYADLSIKADVIAVRLRSQLEKSESDKYRVVYFDEFIDSAVGQKYNEQAVFESLNHSVDKTRDNSGYKGLSLADIDHAAIYCGVFLFYYREALSFLSLIKQFNPAKIIIGADDLNKALFEELAAQMKIKIETTGQFGIVDKSKSDLIRRSNNSVDIQALAWHDINQRNRTKKILILLLNFWSKAVRSIKARKTFVYIDNGGQLSKIKEQLCSQKEYFPLYSELNKLPIAKLLFSGARILPDKKKSRDNQEANKAIQNYLKHLESWPMRSGMGTIELNGKKYSIASIISNQLQKYVTNAFAQIADAIDTHDKFISENKMSGALLSSDMNWKNRMIVHLYRKHQIKTLAQMNGWFGARHMVEDKSVDKVLCFGSSYLDNYFHGKKNVFVTGCQTFDRAREKRLFVNPRHPIKKILISTFTFSPADINCHYGDSEKYLNDILSVINDYNRNHECNLQLALRPHPSDNPEFYRWYLSRLGYSDIKIETERNFQNVVVQYDLYFGSYSTTIFETAAMGIPIIFYHPCNQILYPPFDGSCRELPMARTKGELEGIFQNVMQDKNYALKFTDEKVLAPYTGVMDGMATTRIMNEITKITKSNLIDSI